MSIFIMKTVQLLSVIFTAVALTGCANGYRDFYKANPGEQLSNLILLEPGATPKISHSPNPESDISQLLSKNYRIIGESSFNGKMHSEADLVTQAQSVRATHVLYGSKFVTTQAISTPLFTPNGLGGINTTAFTNQQMRYDQWAYYFAKSKTKLRFGIMTTDLSMEERKTVGSNTGAVVRGVHEDTPAFAANVFKDDVITHVDGKPVRNTEHLGQTLSATPSDAKRLVLTIKRGSEQKDIELNLYHQDM